MLSVLKKIAELTVKDTVLNELRELIKLIKSGRKYILKNKPCLNPYREILSEITYVANGTLLKQDKIILTETLYEKAIKLAHSEAYPGQNGLIRRLRSHFFIRNWEQKFLSLSLPIKFLDTQSNLTKSQGNVGRKLQ